jgi:hypothetical protein
MRNARVHLALSSYPPLPLGIQQNTDWTIALKMMLRVSLTNQQLTVYCFQGSKQTFKQEV